MEQNVYEAINAVMNEVGYVKKTKSAGLSYSYAGESALIEAVRPSMVEHGLFMFVKQVKKIYREQYSTSKGTAMVNTLTEGVVCIMHTSGTFIDVEATGEGADSGDKSANKAMTGLYKYAIRQTFMIETGDDPDKYATEERIASPGSSMPSPAVVKGGMADTATKLAAGLTPKELESAEHMIVIKNQSGKSIPEIKLFLRTLPAEQTYSVSQIVTALKEKE